MCLKYIIAVLFSIVSSRTISFETTKIGKIGNWWTFHLQILVDLQYIFIMGHLDLLWFPITQMCVGIRLSASVPDFVYTIFSTVFCQWLSNFRIWWPWTKTLNWLTFCDYGSIFKVAGGHYVSKLNLFMRYFL